jgi:hypothetical protein
MDSSGNILEEKKITYPMASPLEQTNYIAKIFSSRTNKENIKKYFKTKDGEKAEIRSLGIQNLVAVSIIRDYIDIISVQDLWRSEKSPRPGAKGRRKSLTVNRSGYSSEKYRG